MIKFKFWDGPTGGPRLFKVGSGLPLPTPGTATDDIIVSSTLINWKKRIILNFNNNNVKNYKNV